MDNDDLPVGRILDRREALKLLSIAGATLLAACNGGPPVADGVGGGGAAAAGSGGVPGRTAGSARVAGSIPACVVKPELIEGPYFVDKQLNRSDIRPEPSTGAAMPGVPVTLSFALSRIGNGSCTPLPGAIVDVWQCDAMGEYSGFDDRGVGFDTRGRQFLRGYQVTDDEGLARFTTIYPGWYRGRAVHIHFKIRTDAAPGGRYEFTSQLFFDEALTDRVHARAPYAAKGERDMRNETDRFFRDGGDQLVLDLAPHGDGFETTFGLGLDLTDAETGRSDSSRGFERARPRG